jgi:predicted transcriptional regulator
VPPTRQALVDHLRQPPAPAPAPEPAVLLSIKPHYARLIESGVKRVEFRRRFPRRFERGVAIFYVTSPERAIALVARVSEIQRGAPGELWRRFGPAGGTGREDFDAYFAGVEQGVAIVLEDVRALRAPIALDDPRLRAVGFRAPQSLVVLPADSRLAQLVTAVHLDALRKRSG